MATPVPRPITYEVTDTGCHECTSHKPKGRGYSSIKQNGKLVLIHRLIYEQTFGSIPEGIIVRHMCDNPRCINPNHLELGSHQDNMTDMKERGRSTRTRNNGSTNGRSKLTEDQVRAIKFSSTPNYILAEQYGIHRTTVSEIKRGIKWAHLN